MRCLLRLTVALMMLGAATIASVAQETGNLTDALIRYAKFEYKEALERLLPLGHHGDPVAQEVIAFMYARGGGIPAGQVVALGWFRLAAEAGRVEAQYELGRLYRDGLGTPVNGSAAMLWFSRASDQGAAHAMNAMGELYLGRAGLAADYVAARRWFTKAVEHGSAQAMLNLGFLYALGRGVDRDEIEAFKWFDLAVREGPDGPDHRASRARMTMAERLTPVEIRTATISAKQWFELHRISSSEPTTAPGQRNIVAADVIVPNDVRWAPLAGDGSN